tara:strand:+ start:361 stop:633 length:273 start_codon:yes stop_codon:yes gene_type:complete
MGRSSNSFTGWITGGHVNNSKNVDPETKLFTAVLAQAVHDVFSSHVEKINRAQAMDFLTEDSYHLRMICDLAGRDADYVRQKIRKKLLET